MQRTSPVESLEPLVLMSASPIEGTSSDDWISGTNANDIINAGAGNDSIHAPLGNNQVNGGDGVDALIVYEGTQDDFTVERHQDGLLILSGPGLNGTHTRNELIDVEQILFNDGVLLTEDVPVANEPPVANDDLLTVANVELLVGNLLANDFDTDKNRLTTEVGSGPQHGELQLNSNGTFSYAPNSEFTGIDSFTYRISDKYGGEDSAEVLILVNAADGDPGADDADDDPSSSAKSSSAKSSSAKSSSAKSSSAKSSSAKSAKSAKSGSDNSVNATVLFPPVTNSAPIAESEDFVVLQGESIIGNVIENDSDADNDQLLTALATLPKHGSAVLNLDGTFSYVANDGFSGTDSFTYRVVDANGAESFGRVNVEVRNSQSASSALSADRPSPGNDPAGPSGGLVPVISQPDDSWVRPTGLAPDADADIFATTINGRLAGTLVANDSDPDGDTLSIIESTTAQYGTATVRADGTFEYIAAEGFSGIDYFHYVASDGDQTDRATVVIHISADGALPADVTQMIAAEVIVSPIVFDLNDDGVINVTGQTTAKNRPAGLELGRTVSFDIDADGTPDTIEWIAGTGDGILVDTSQFQGTDIDGEALFGDEGGRYANGFEKLSLLDLDGNRLLEDKELARLKLWVDDGDAILQAGELDTLQQHGIFSVSTRMRLTPDGLMQSWAFNHNDSEVLIEDVWFGTDHTNALNADGTAGPSSEEQNESANLKPDADPDVFTEGRGKTIQGNVLSNDHDPDGDRILVARYSKPLHGTLSVSDDGSFSYRPDPEFTGTDYFQYEIVDGNGGRDTAIVTLNVEDRSSAVVPVGNTVVGTIWHDENGDGLQNKTEQVRGTSVYVSLISKDGQILQGTHTDANGQYAFRGISDGQYRVRVAATSLPESRQEFTTLALMDVNSNLFDKIDSDLSRQTGQSALFSLSEDVVSVAIDAGYVFA